MPESGALRKRGLFFCLEGRMEMVEREVERQFAMIAAQSEEIIPEDEFRTKLRRALESGNPLRIKYGIDPTIPHIHIGHLVPCRVIRAFQDLGHTAVLVIGDYTARIGDPTGRNAERQALSETEVNENMQQYGEQLFRVVDRSSAEVRYQSSWFGSLSLSETIRLLSSFSAAQILAHETFRARMDAGTRLSLHEIIYPVLQAYDSVMIDADVEIGGTDQRFNCLCGRDLQRDVKTEPQVVVTVPLLLGADGEKMSKSLGNHVSVNSSANEIVGRVMSIPDSLLVQYAVLTTDWSSVQRDQFLESLRVGSLHPKKAKLTIAENIAAQLHGMEESRHAVEEFERVFSRREKPEAVEQVVLSDGDIGIIALIVNHGMAKSKSEARRLVQQGAVRVDDRVVMSVDETIETAPGAKRLVRVGKRRFLEIVSATGAT